MRFHAMRLLRTAIVALPTVWFVYVLHSILFLQDSSSSSSINARDYDSIADEARRELDKDSGERRDGGGNGGGAGVGGKELWHGTGAHQADSKLLGGDSAVDVINDRGNNNNNNNIPEKAGRFRKGLQPVHQGSRSSNNQKRRPNVMVRARSDRQLRGRKSLREGSLEGDLRLTLAALPEGPNNKEAGANKERGSSMPGDGVDAAAVHGDDYANVTYPPFVEWLPSGSKGQGRYGLSVDKEKLSAEEKQLYENEWEKNSFNQYASDRIPVRRELPDFRADKCKQKIYPSVLPNVSVVIIFHNEAWSVLLRSVHSILNRTTSEMLVEIILVDDLSTMDHLKRPLEKYFRDYPKVKIVRMPVRGGLTKARLRGFGVSTGEVVVFLDSHIECTEGWAEPLLWMIQENYRTVPFPLIDLIGAGDLSYVAHQQSPYGIFSMNSLTFKWTSSLQRPARDITEPKPSPTMPGGLFAIHRQWFNELGQYDPELDYWGGENMELSFKAWMCGGSVVIAECSHIGHIFRQTNPIKWTHNLGNRNYVRVAMVWMDEYKNHYLERTRYQLGVYGDVSERLALRNSLQCHGFGWYVDNVYPELKEQLVFNATYAGEVHNGNNQCLDKMDEKHIGPQLFPCHHLGSNQFWYFREDKYLQLENMYLCRRGDTVRLCTEGEKDEFSYNNMCVCVIPDEMRLPAIILR